MPISDGIDRNGPGGYSLHNGQQLQDSPFGCSTQHNSINANPM